jgi:signal transduction histidine kinase
LVNIIESVVENGKDDIKRKGLTLEFKKSNSRVPRVMMDAEKIKLVIQNLLENAVRYTPSGGKIVISVGADKEKIEFQIADNGIGIAKDQQSKIFTKFFRGSNVMRVETEGSGLGLFVSKNIIEAHGGQVWFESKEGEGSVFHFTLPVKKELEEFLKEF